MINTSHFEECFTKALVELDESIKDKGSDYFYTEKEIHSYFYHICQAKKIFDYAGTYLVHTEYPTPFKCRNTNDADYVIRIEDNVNGPTRAHIDLVLVNPNFIDWIKNNNHDLKYIYGLAGKGDSRFEKYIRDYKEKYSNFMKETQESIILNAIEFKYIRHAYDGIKTTIHNINQDKKKIQLLLEYKINGNSISFFKTAFSKVYIGKRFYDENKKIELEKIKNHTCDIVYIGD